MWSHRKSRQRPADTEALLRAHRSEPRDEFVRELSGQVRENDLVRRPTAWSRVAFAGSISTLIIGMFAAVGGFSYAASSAKSSYSVAKQIVVTHKVTINVDRSSAQQQYPGTPTPPEQPPQQETAGQANTAGNAAGQVASAQTLPFTGISLLTTALLGAALLALGLILRRRERRSS
jgi:hypothetical protein